MTDRSCDQLDDYLCGWLAPDEAVAYEAHLADCAACREECARQRQIDQLLAEATVATAPVPAALSSRVAGRIRAARRRRALGWAGAVAAATIVVIAAGLLATKSVVVPPQEERQTAQGSSAGNDVLSPIASLTSPEPPAGGAHVTMIDPSAAIVMPMESRHPNITIVRVFPTIAATSEDESPSSPGAKDVEKSEIE
jgi:anti-sigma factor RsiW